MLNQAGLPTTLPYLENLTARWETSKAAIRSPLWREADELSRHMLRSWPRGSWREEDDTGASRMLDLQVRLGNVERVDAFLAGVSAEGHYAAPDNAAIVRAAALLAAPRATELLMRIVARNASAHLSACGDLLLRCVTASTGATADLAQIGAALIEAAPGAPTNQQEVAPWTRPAPVKPGFVVGLLTAASRTDARLAARRSHVEDSVRRAACDLDLATERRGSPHTLVATKNQATYERRAKQRRQDLEHVSALGG
ncbi:hypothetical protein [Bradyrhizobium sp.]|uniref:hypothetical protein n=1 Tax=Bradyrhizobium sp. TaxID=376 RepID=UPI00238BC76A|nr:hypothetical protein [Bradyrhizobium sp.]MDE2379595.1 hypothetical protein [Bradyrhizobium sp.]